MDPHSIEGKESGLGAVLISSEAADVAREPLHPEDVYKPEHQSTLAAIATMFDANEPIDAMTVMERTSQLYRTSAASGSDTHPTLTRTRY